MSEWSSDWSNIVDKLIHDKKPKKKTPPKKLTSNAGRADMDLIMAAVEATIATDVAKQANQKATEAKNKLKLMMQSRNIDSISMPDRGEISLKTNTNKSFTKKALTEVLGKEEADYVWDRLPNREYKSLTIPKKPEPEPDDP